MHFVSSLCWEILLDFEKISIDAERQRAHLLLQKQVPLCLDRLNP